MPQNPNRLAVFHGERKPLKPFEGFLLARITQLKQGVNEIVQRAFRRLEHCWSRGKISVI